MPRAFRYDDREPVPVLLDTLRQILQVGSSFVCRIRDNTLYHVIDSPPRSDGALPAGIVRAGVVRFTGQPALDREKVCQGLTGRRSVKGGLALSASAVDAAPSSPFHPPLPAPPTA